MRCQRVDWHHESPDEPVPLYSELDDAGLETRKVDVYRDGRRDYAAASKATGSTQLSEVAMPSLEEISEQAEFSPVEIGSEEFEEIWRFATDG